MSEGQETQTFSTAVLLAGGAICAGSDITVHKGFTVHKVWGSYPMLSR